jgi:hypothetical protein
MGRFLLPSGPCREHHDIGTATQTSRAAGSAESMMIREPRSRWLASKLMLYLVRHSFDDVFNCHR